MSRINKPNYTMLPNVLIESMGEMSESEFRIVVAVARKTFGWQKDLDLISLSQLVLLTGMSRQGVLNGINSAIENGWLARTARGQSFIYQLLVNEVDQPEKPTSQRSRLVLVNEVDQSEGKLVNEVDTQKKESKEKETNIVAPTPRAVIVSEDKAKLRELDELFSKLTGLSIPSPRTAKEGRASGEMWFQPMRRMLAQANGTAISIMRSAVEKMKFEKLTIASPKSIEKTFLALAGERKLKGQFRTEKTDDPFAQIREAIAQKENQNAR